MCESNIIGVDAQLAAGWANIAGQSPLASGKPTTNLIHFRGMAEEKEKKRKEKKRKDKKCRVKKRKATERER